jgi:DNA-binding winged helix-turn-helix (wHTH) protein
VQDGGTLKELYNLQIPQLFLEGRFNEVCEAFESRKTLQKNSDFFPYWIGSLIFSGQLEKAQILSKQLPLTSPAQGACRFYLALGLIRNSQYKDGRRYLIENLRYLKNHQNIVSAREKFYIFQGIAFYRFFCGRFSQGKRYAEQAFSSAVEDGFLFGEMLSKELLAHALVQTGQVRLGLRYFTETLSVAKKHRSWLAPTIEIAILKFKFQFGIENDAALASLESALERIETRDIYSKGELLLEMIRQYILRGQFTKAEDTVAKASDIIYKSQNRRQMALFNLRMSYVLFLQAQYAQALHILRFAEQNVEPTIDLNLCIQVSGLKLKLYRELNKNKDSQLLVSELHGKSHQSQSFIHQKIMARENGKVHPFPKGEDPIGDLLDEVANENPKAPEMVLKSGYYGLLHKCYHLPFGTQTLIFDLHPGTLILLNKGNVSLKSKGFNSVLRKIILFLNDSPKSKEDLVREVWGYDYDPLRHDSLVYSSINKIRKLLAPHEDWMQLTEEGYCLSRNVKVIVKNNLTTSFLSKKTRTTDRKVQPLKAKARLPSKWSKHLKDLNFRQIQILDYLKEDSSISVQELSTRLLISKPTATRDLSRLYELGIVSRIGLGRATRYFL